MASRLSSPIISRFFALQSAFLGLFASSYLLYAYVAHRPVVCGASSGCEIVRLSEWAYVFGTIPRPLLGVLFYAAILLLLLVRVAWGSRRRGLWRLMQILIVVGVVESVILFFVQWRELGAFCLWCLLSAVASLELGIVALFDRPVSDDAEVRSLELRGLLGLMAVFGIACLGGLWLLLR